ncbi:MAG: TetR/AcrR family transcriptional regulator [Desulfarculaceae bacterium]|nr:TetR/AcrR family transcriptional regulator [Desulfarculaceae bacterium]MCF8071851.1 TetR/AcrR family transcriptional regulator [Desulfarculaceae bacterium]MCF8101401.1 TetR/AcrR family transcriptional regulator [Desulfarculaceae bacterium]MCF8117392.1 TetR/AcrR family transcriptional regulator [Desulfarculaceae bacterium]
MPPSSTFNNLPPDKQDRILDEALSEFAAVGYARASVNRLVARLGIAKGSIFQYFRDKPGLFSQVFDFAVERVKRHLRAVREATRGQDVFTRLEKSLLAGLELIDKNPRLFQLYLRVVFEGDVPFRGRLLASIRIFSHDYIMDLLGDGVAAGDLMPDLDLELAAFVVDATLERFLVASAVEHMDPGLGLNQADAARAAELAAGLVATLRAGLGARP